VRKKKHRTFAFGQGIIKVFQALTGYEIRNVFFVENRKQKNFQLVPHIDSKGSFYSLFTSFMAGNFTCNENILILKAFPFVAGNMIKKGAKASTY
jgi:hypothetical protein